MWIKEPIFPLGKSLNEELNFLWNKDNIYVMDNHLAAGWAWLTSIDVKKKHTLFHIDRHYDLLDFPEVIKSEILDKGILIHELSLNDYLNLKQPSTPKDYPLFRWDNYILNVHCAYPEIFEKTYFATQKEDNNSQEFVNKEIEFYDLLENISYWIESSTNDCIVNIDIDYFFSHTDCGLIQTLTDDYISCLGRALKKNLPKIKVLTICLSPECCGGWDIAKKKTLLIAKELNISFGKDLQALKKEES